MYYNCSDIDAVLGAVQVVFNTISAVINASSAMNNVLSSPWNVLHGAGPIYNEYPDLPDSLRQQINNALLCYLTQPPSVCNEQLGQTINDLIAAINALFEADYAIRFRGFSEQHFGFDSLMYQPMVDDYNYLTVAGQPYRVAWKSVEAGRPDNVLLLTPYADLPDSLHFETNSRTPVPHHEHACGATCTDNGAAILPVTGGAHNETHQIYPVQTRTDSLGNPQRKYAGKLNVVSYNKKEVNVVLVPINGAGNLTDSDRAAIEAQLNEIYRPAVAAFSVELRQPSLSLGWFEAEAQNTLDSTNSAFYADYNNQMQRINQEINNLPDYDPDKYYLMLVHNAQGGIEGFMPRARNKGFIVTSGHGSLPQLGRTIAHELGHGAFRLRHPWEQFSELAPGDTDNLMDYASGTRLHHYQWHIVHNPPPLGGIWQGDEESASIENNKLISITFIGCEKIMNVAAPHWEVTELSILKPVCYVRNTPMKAKIVINEPNVAIRPLYVKATVGQEEFVQTLSVMQDGNLMNSVDLEMISFQQVNYLDDFIIRWYTSVDGEEWIFNVATRHKVYVVLAPPINNLYDLFEPILYYSCREAQGVTDEETLIQRVWSKFTERNLRISDFKPIDDNSSLTYYRNPFPYADKKWDILNSMPVQGSQYLDGECGAFRDLFHSSLGYHGVVANWIGVQSEVAKEYFLVKNWMFDDELVVQLDNPYHSYQYRQASEVEVIESQTEWLDENAEPYIVHTTQYFPDIRREGHQYAWLDLFPVSVNDVQGVEGQGVLNPYSDFGLHHMVKINGYYYDPSYGKRFSSLKDWEENSVAGYFVFENMNHPVTGELILHLYFRKNEVNETTIIEFDY